MDARMMLSFIWCVLRLRGCVSKLVWLLIVIVVIVAFSLFEAAMATLGAR